LYGKYLAEDCSNTVTGLCYINNEDYALYANDKFLYRSDAICTQGMGRVRDGRYISCTIPVTWEGMPSSRDNILFEWKGDPGKHVAFKTAARNPGNFDLKDKKIYIPELVTVLHMEGLDHPNLDGFFTVNDIGGKLDIDTIDIYIGEGQQIYDKFYFIVRGIENTPVYIRP
jgi:3D (Asp-Asp-Asp) domain-containing protein